MCVSVVCVREYYTCNVASFFPCVFVHLIDSSAAKRACVRACTCVFTLSNVSHM